MGDSNKIKSFEDLLVWQRAIALSVKIYKQTENFPRAEQFGITNQIRRASASVPANISEGFGRVTAKDKIQFYTIAYGSLLETKNFVYLSAELGFINPSIKQELVDAATELQKLINGFIRSTKDRMCQN